MWEQINHLQIMNHRMLNGIFETSNNKILPQQSKVFLYID